ncbi:MAG: tyrosine--tRNA ligase [Bacteroidales bacterium]|nr:tyrosine--tRNA ligase [Bacteroidales bacterium]MCF8351273.1 tyrosine--tRNA ligase [Bacteroidales bacterium]MCF8377574.1 tyrosine--tRNA ligase [Bacteroidales bacterium]MCF8401845.1 tyrosine--tRNA ligase [Bacteroidales bacterium]
MDFIEELKWRGMIHDVMPGTEEQLKKEMTAGYIGFDPTADSLHIGSLATIMLLVHFQRAGHKPVVLVGGATGMVGDPSGKSQERQLLDVESINKNLEGQKRQLMNFLNFDSGENSAIVVNNYEWFKGYEFLEFIRDIGKHITVNYMMAKDSVKKRLEAGLSFTEFSYQLVQGYDFLWLYENKNCKLQMGGSDQWGNITTGTELIRRKIGGEAYALTTPLVTKADGGKFGKTEGGNIWLDPERSSPYAFYQFWLNTSDRDAERYIKIFTLYSREEIEELIAIHKEEPHRRVLQKALAKDITVRVHSEEDYNAAMGASQILFGKGTTEMLRKLDERTLLSVFEGVPQYELDREVITGGTGIIDFLAEKTDIFKSKGEARRMLKDNGVSVNKQKVKEDYEISEKDLLKEKYILVQKGKKNYFLVKVLP